MLLCVFNVLSRGLYGHVCVRVCDHARVVRFFGFFLLFIFSGNPLQLRWPMAAPAPAPRNTSHKKHILIPDFAHSSNAIVKAINC
jgi:hypothetical protein